MEKDDTTGQMLQRNLRLSFGFMLIWPFATILVVVFAHVAFFLPIVALVASGMTYMTFRQQFGPDPRNWWFLWRGPLVIVPDMKKWEEADKWLDEVAGDRYRRVYIATYKFKNKSDATAFKLVFG